MADEKGKDNIDIDEILIIDDSLSNLKLLESLLTVEGYRVRLAQNPFIGLQSAQVKSPGLILLDINMPEMDGFEVCRQLKKDARTQEIPIIFVSAKNDLNDQLKGFEVGGVDYITKPIQQLEMLARVRTHLTLYKMQVNLESLVDKRTEEIKQTYNALKKSEAKYRRLIEGLGSEHIIYAHDIQGVYYYLSPSVKQMLGYSPEEYQEHHAQYHTDNPINQAAKQYSALSIKGQKQPPYEIEIYKKQGSICWLELSEVPVFNENGEVEAIEGIARDITERKHFEQTQALAATAFESQEGIVITNAEGCILRVNDAFSKLTGYSSGEVVGSYSELLKSARHDDLFYKAICNSLYTKGHWDGEIWSRRKNADVHPEWVSITAVKNKLGKIIHYILNFQHNKMELEKQQILNNELIKLDKIKDLFLANTTHEIRTPLNGIIGLTESIIESETNEKKLEKLSMIAASGKRLAGLINDILDYSKIKNGLLEIEKHPVDLFTTVNIVINIMSVFVQSKPVELINDVMKDSPSVLGDKNRIQQIFFNIIGNAIKYTDTGSIRVYNTISNDVMKVVVQDTGLGIKAEDIDTVFDLFVQSKSEDQRELVGTGIGLTITKQLVELHKGSINIQSQLNIGTQVIFTLPISKEKAVIPTSEKIKKRDNQAVVHSKKDYCVLIVDDNPVNLMVLKGILDKRYQLIEANSGKDALAKLSEQPQIDIVILDVMMPGLSGFETCKIIRKNYSSHILPVLFLTGSSTEKDIQQGLQVGGNEFIIKPVSKDPLLKLVCKYLPN